VTSLTRRIASQLSPHGLTAKVLADKLATDIEPIHRSAYSAETDNNSLVIDESELANSLQNALGSISG
jgi:hypothetical protein